MLFILQLIEKNNNNKKNKNVSFPQRLSIMKCVRNLFLLFIYSSMNFTTHQNIIFSEGVLYPLAESN